MKNKHRLKICVGASAGGHMTQLLRLLKYSGNWPSPPAVYITTLEAFREKLSQKGHVFVIGECNRKQPFQALKVLLKSFKIVQKLRPDVVITTGSLPLAMVCFFAKLFGAKIVWIDSIANIETLSLSGRTVRLFSDLFLVQWQHLVKKYKNVEYVGNIL